MESAKLSRRIALAVAMAIALFALLAGSRLIVASGLVRVGLYGLDEHEVKAVAYLLGEGYRFTEYAQDLKSLGHKPKEELLIYKAWTPFEADTFEAVPKEIMLRTVPSMRAAGSSGPDMLAMPILMDHVGLSIHKESMSRLGLVEPADLRDLESALASWSARRQASVADGKRWPLVFAGGEDEDLLQLVSLMLVGEAGAEGYDAVRDALRSGTGWETLMELALGPGRGRDILRFSGVLGRLKSWIRERYVHPEWHSLRLADLKAVLESNGAFMSVHALSFQRSVNPQVLSGFSNSRFPGVSKEEGMGILMITPLTVVSPRKASDGRGIDALYAMTEAAKGKEAAQLSRRASALSASNAPDLQAADALAWAAASSRLANGLYHDGFLERAEAAAFAARVREWLRQ